MALFALIVIGRSNGPFPSSLQSLFQSESKSEIFVIVIGYNFNINEELTQWNPANTTSFAPENLVVLMGQGQIMMRQPFKLQCIWTLSLILL